MKNVSFLVVILLLAYGVSAQQVEPARYEVIRWDKDQECRFEPLGDEGGMLVYETDQTDKDKSRLWNFVTLDSSFYELRSDLIPLSNKMDILDSASDDDYVVFLFSSDKSRKSETADFNVVCYHRQDGTFSSFGEKLPDKSLILSAELLDGVLMLAVNSKAGNGFLLFYDLQSNVSKKVTPSSSDSFVLFQTEAFAKEHAFVVAAKEYQNKFFNATSFWVYSRSGDLMGSYRYDNHDGVALGRMCFGFDANRKLTVYGTLERESAKKVKLEGVLNDFDKISIGVVWLKFDGSMGTKAYLFKDMPEIELALKASDRVRVREERIRLRQGKKKEKGEIAFQFLTPRLVKYDDLSVFCAEAFVPEYHTETRMDYGFYGMYPYSYTVFDGYDFISDILLAFDAEGNLRWQTSVKFENELCYDLTPHAGEGVCHDELVVASSYHNRLRYVVFDKDGTLLLPLQEEKIDPLFGADYIEDEFFAEVKPWYDSRFWIYGSQIMQNSILPKSRRTIYYLQKVQFD